MKTTEFKKVIIGTNNVAWFNSVEINLSFPCIDLNLNFKGLASLHKFAEQQFAGWQKIEHLPKELESSKGFFLVVLTDLENFVNSFSSVTEDSSLDSYFRNSLLTSINNRNSNIFTYDSTEIDFLLKVFSEFPKSFLSAYTYFCGNLNQNISQKDNFNGYLMAYEFKSSNSDISKRTNSEKISFRV